MTKPIRKSEVSLILGFLALIFAVPLAQTCLDLSHGDRVQFTDVFRYRPTAKNLRLFERTLEERSWFQQKLRPPLQRFLFQLLRETSAKVVLGREDWLFYRPDIRHLVEPNRLETDSTNSTWVQPSDGSTHRDNVVRAIVQFRDQLKARGIELLVVPAPGKPSIYPDHLTRRMAGQDQALLSPTLELLYELRQRGVAAADLFTQFRQHRLKAGYHSDHENLYLARDTHWTPVGAKSAAHAVAQRIKDLGWAPPASRQFQTQLVQVKRYGDLVDMMQMPGLKSQFPGELVECEQVNDPALGPLVPSKSDRPGTFKYPGQRSSILVLGDSFCRIYQMPEPPSLGAALRQNTEAKPGQAAASTVKRLLPGSAGFISHLALALNSPVDAIVSDGGASTDVRKRLSTNPEILESKKVIVWEFVERDISLGKNGWEMVPLPPKLNAQ
jgi:hypothetical protein